MKKFFKNIVITKTTIALAIITIVAVAINNYTSYELFEELSRLTLDNNTTLVEFNESTQYWEKYCRWIGLPLMIFSLVLPFFWAWQNYNVFKKKWLFIVAVVSIYFGLQHVCGDSSFSFVSDPFLAGIR